MVFYLGVVIGTILERYFVYTQHKGFIKQQKITTYEYIYNKYIIFNILLLWFEYLVLEIYS